MNSRELQLRGEAGVEITSPCAEHPSSHKGHSIIPALVPPRTIRRTRRGVTQLQIPRGKPDIESLKRVIDEWLVPLLVKDFLEQYCAKSQTAESANSEVPQPERKGRRRAK